MVPVLQSLRKMGTGQRSILVAFVDATIAVVSLAGAMLLRFSGEEVRRLEDVLPSIVLVLVVARLAWNVFFRLHRWSFMLSGLTDGARVVMAGVSGTALFVLALHLIQPGLPATLGRAVLVLELLLSTSLMAMIRFAPRLGLAYRANLRGRRPEAVVTAIVGAGSAGEMLLRALQRSERHDFHVVGFIDDERGKHGQMVGSKQVLGAVADLPRLVDRYGIKQVLIAIPHLPARRVRQILELGTHLKLSFKILPSTYGSFREKAAPTLLQDLTPEDLLDREEVEFKQGAEASVMGTGHQMVVGAAGSIGSEVCAQLLEAGCRRLVMLDIDENGLYLLKCRLGRRFSEATVFAEIADIRDSARLKVLFAQYRPQDVFHAAARKHVPLMETAPCEAVKTNVFGTLVLAQIAAESEVERFVFMSTDKAVRPMNVMGATKRLGEMLMRTIGESSKTHFSVVRFGNVLGSAGSVVPLFREQIEAGGPVTVTHPEARRYFMTISEAVGLVLRAAYGEYGRLCVLEMGEQIKIDKLARLMITMSGRVPDVDVRIVYVGLRPGEKLEEELIGEGEKVIRQIDSKIRVVEGPAPHVDLLVELGELKSAAAIEDHEAVRYWLRQLIPDYRPLFPTSSGEVWVEADTPVM